MFGDVPALDHEVGDEAVEGAALVPEPEFPSAKGPERETPFYSKIAFCLLYYGSNFPSMCNCEYLPEVLCRLRCDLVVQVEVYSSQGLPVHRHVHKAQLSGVCLKRGNKVTPP